ncbi:MULTISPECIES: putative Ig domain-containing protein [Pseudomonas chlororaphis group]|uniref:putative Ig domain-containing protein n=1 Tax=Pseudomonas chlororaphis group TaxID=136842 RepID=UPI0020976AB1|nr:MULTISPECIES: putative Ig domain-containing protein [Pseudomonas chlororaphis group]MCO7579070.1 putative Ig domain-containing protein [Pseudomonas protegens]MCO7585199.1 putative Ig domain-containing protein [Pseudomonas chlororaphis]MCO7602156.1 putative Ig domain-containing protein [Pseudomonas chlororaphis]
MRTPLTAPGNWLTRPLISLFLLLVMLSMSSQAMAVAPVITNPASGSTLPTIAVGQSMSITISSVGGTMPLDRWVECDANDPDYDGVTPCLPPGLILDASPGNATTVLHGTPTTAGNYTFSITLNDGNNDGGVATYNLLVTSSATPTLTSVTPNTGSTAGATSVTLTGTNFTGATAVSFGGTAATGYIVNNATTITATTPAHAAGAVNVAVTTPGGSATLTNGYTYAVPAPTVGPVSATVAANSSANPITLSLSGGAATSVAVASAASHGTATASGTSITYTPTAGFSGSDSFTYTATNTSGTSSPATVTITVTPPTLAITPTTLPDGTQGAAYSQTLSATGGTAPYTYAISAGSLPAGLSLNTSTGVISGTPSASGTNNLTVTATDANSATGSRAYSLVINGLAPVANAVSATVAANSSANPITLNITGGAATSVAVASAASHGTATASGTSITYTPTAGFSGSDSFTYTATNASGTSSPATVTITVSAPSIVLSPGSLSNGTVGTAYNASLSASGGAAPYSYAITAGTLPTGLSLNTSTGAISGTPSASGTFNLTVTATDANSATGSQAYSITIGAQAPVAGAVSATVAANSSANPITLNLSGGAATSVAVASAASHGTATASGTSITYTPTAGFSGSDSFTYTATNASGTSSPATVTITVSAPSIVLSPGSLSNGTVGTAYSASLSASGGAAPYSYAITAGTLPTGLSLNTSTGAISGTPSASGTFNLTITATDANSATGSQAYSITIGAQAPVAGAVSATVSANSSANPITLNLSGGAATSVAVASAASHGTASASGTSITYTPTAGFSGADSFTYTATNASGTSSPATVTITVSAPTLVLTPASLGAGTAGSAYSATLSVSGGTAPYSYSISSGSLPAGLSLNTASGLISGTPSTSGTANLTITATDANGATGSQAYSITIAAVAISVPASSQILAAGQSATVDLTQGATGGPFTQAVLGSVTPASAGQARMMGPFSMRFVPSAAFAGTAIVSFSLQNGSGSSASSTITFTIQERSDPTKDAEVIGLLNAQTRAAERFASTQMDNFNRRLEQLHQISCDRNSFNASLRKEGREVPLGEIAKAVQDQLGASANQTEQEKREAAAALKDNCQQDALAFWSDGFVNVGSTHARGARDNSFTTLGLSAGVDYRLSPTAVAGIGFGYGNDRSDIGKNHTRSDADAIGIATYLSLNLAPQVYVDGLLGYNRISFDSRRYITGSADDYARGSRDADQLFASLTASYEYRQGPLSLTPYSRLNASTTRLDAYRESGGGIYGLSYDEQRQQNFTSYLGVRSGYDLMTPIGVVTPKVGLAWGHNFSNSSDYKMRYTDQGDEGTLYRLKPDALDSDFASLDMGVDFNLGRAWQLGVSYKTALGSDERNDTFRLGLNGKF